MTLIWYFDRLQSLLKIGSLKGKTLFFLIFCVTNQVVMHIQYRWSICDKNLFRFEWGLYSGYSPYFILSAVFDINCGIKYLFLWIFYFELLRKVFLLFDLTNQSAHSPEQCHLFSQAKCFEGPFKSVVYFFGASGAKSTVQKRGMILDFFLHEIQLIFKFGGLCAIRWMNSLGLWKELLCGATMSFRHLWKASLKRT